MIESRLEDFKYELAALEHQRWVIYKLCDGWIPADDYHVVRRDTAVFSETESESTGNLREK